MSKNWQKRALSFDHSTRDFLSLSSVAYHYSIHTHYQLTSDASDLERGVISTRVRRWCYQNAPNISLRRFYTLSLGFIKRSFAQISFIDLYTYLQVVYTKRDKPRLSFVRGLLSLVKLYAYDSSSYRPRVSVLSRVTRVFFSGKLL